LATFVLVAVCLGVFVFVYVVYGSSGFWNDTGTVGPSTTVTNQMYGTGNAQYFAIASTNVFTSNCSNDYTSADYYLPGLNISLSYDTTTLQDLIDGASGGWNGSAATPADGTYYWCERDAVGNDTSGQVDNFCFTGGCAPSPTPTPTPTPTPIPNYLLSGTSSSADGAIFGVWGGMVLFLLTFFGIIFYYRSWIRPL